ncbi:serine/threonine protein kinase [Apiospora rasikravindrae]|uniref:Serine/threonine protein kinase n=1 Tax=Apiospora rasikravindrae TaxID=990691 RepID=A0ABR1TZU9_9PEZI
MSTTTSSSVGIGGAPMDQVPATTAGENSQIQPPKYEIRGMHEDEVEDVEMYRPGGFILFILMMAASHSSEDSGELLITRLLGDNSVDSAAAHHIMLPDAHFWVSGPNGRHLALVLPLLGPSLPEWLKFHQHRFELKKKLCRQMVRAIQFLQTQGVCHGDFMPNNVLMKVRNLDHLTKDEILKALTSEISAGNGIFIDSIRTLSGEDPGPNAPSYAVVPTKWPIEDEDKIIIEDIAIVDFGEAFVPGHFKGSQLIPGAFAAPEVTFMSEPGLPSDTWSLGATIMDVLGTSPFHNDVAPFTSSLEKYLGPLPVKYRADFEKLRNEGLAVRYEYEKINWQDWVYMKMVKPDDKPELMVFSLTNSQRNDPAHPAAYESVAALEEARNQARQSDAYSHAISAALGKAKQIFFEETDPRYNPESMDRYKMPRDEAELLTDLALKIFRYEPSERITTAEIMEHDCLRGKEGVEEGSAAVFPKDWVPWPF